MDGQKIDITTIHNLDEIVRIKRYLLITVSVFHILALVPASYYNLLLDTPEHFYLAIVEMILTGISTYTIYASYRNRKIEVASAAVVLTSFIVSISTIILMKGQFYSYTLMLMTGVLTFAVLPGRTAIITYAISIMIVLYLSLYVHNARDEAVVNYVVAAIIIAVVLLASSLSNKIALEALAISSRTDELTGLWNRKMFNHLCNREIEIANRTQLAFSLLVGDIDHFKLVNDTYGHDKGDEIVKLISQLLRENIRSTDEVARWGGEEFAIILPNTEKGDAIDVANKLRARIQNTTFDKVGNVTMSFGVTTYVDKDESSALFKRADEALYTSKENGRNKITQK